MSPRRSRLASAGGRLVAITGASFAPDNPAWASAFARLQERGRVVFSAAIDGAVYAKHGTTINTRLTIIDKLPADDPAPFSKGVAPDVATLMGWLDEQLSARLPVDPSVVIPVITTAAPRSVRLSQSHPPAPPRPHPWPNRRALPNSPMRRSTGRPAKRAVSRRHL